MTQVEHVPARRRGRPAHLADALEDRLGDGGGEAAFTMHVGPYQAIGQSWEKLMAWVGEQGRSPGGPTWEVYIDDPQETPEAELKTELYIPLA